MQRSLGREISPLYFMISTKDTVRQSTEWSFLRVWLTRNLVDYTPFILEFSEEYLRSQKAITDYFLSHLLKMQSMIRFWFAKCCWYLCSTANQITILPSYSWSTVLIGWDCLWLSVSVSSHTSFHTVCLYPIYRAMTIYEYLRLFF